MALHAIEGCVREIFVLVKGVAGVAALDLPRQQIAGTAAARRAVTGLFELEQIEAEHTARLGVLGNELDELLTAHEAHGRERGVRGLVAMGSREDDGAWIDRRGEAADQRGRVRVE